MIKDIALYLVIGILAKLLISFLHSALLLTFLESNIITILIALLAINITTMSVLLTKINELAEKFGGKFTRTIPSLKKSIYEQLALIVLSCLILVVKGSPVICKISHWSVDICDVLLLSVFVAGIYILYDTGKSIFILADFDKNANENKQSKGEK